MQENQLPILLNFFEPLKLMNMKINTPQLLTFCIVLIAIALPMFSQAQPGFDDTVNDVPVDGGLSLLVAAGIGYGAKKLRKK